MKSFIYILAISFALMSFACGQMPFLPCADGSPAPVFVDKNCTAALCNFTSEGDSFTKFQFTAPSQVSSLDLRILYMTTADMAKVETFETVEDACELLIDAECPLQEGQIATINQPLVNPIYAVTVMGLAEYRLLDPNGSTISCFNFACVVLPAE